MEVIYRVAPVCGWEHGSRSWRYLGNVTWMGSKVALLRCRVTLNFLLCHSSVPSHRGLECARSSSSSLLFTSSQCTLHVFLSLLDMRRGRLVELFLPHHQTAVFCYQSSTGHDIIRRIIIIIITVDGRLNSSAQVDTRRARPAESWTRHHTLNNAHSKYCVALFSYFLIHILFLSPSRKKK